MTGPGHAAILKAIEERYGSLEHPNYAFVAELVDDQPFAELVTAISNVVDVEETTDVNDDVSFRYLLADEARRWTLDLSMVGPYGLLMRLAPSLIVVTDDSALGTELEIVRLLQQAGISLLSRTTLESPLPFRRLGAETEHATIYHALISDESLPPWDTAG